MMKQCRKPNLRAIERSAQTQSAGQMELPTPSYGVVTGDLTAAGFVSVFESLHGVNIYSMWICLSDGAQVLLVAAGWIGMQPADYIGLGTEIFALEAMTVEYLRGLIGRGTGALTTGKRRG